MSIPGRATPEGTRRYRERLGTMCAKGHFREAAEYHVGSLGIGTYLGEPDEPTDRLVSDAVVESAKQGINLIDTAINYRFERAERSINEALQRLVKVEGIARDEVLVCSKGGYLPVSQNPSAWFKKEYAGKRKNSIKMSDLAAGCHCMHPEYLSDQLDRSLTNLGVSCIDVYYVHNPEAQAGDVSMEIFRDRLRLAFEALEAAVAQDKIGCYGVASWDAFRSPQDHPSYMDLADVKALAKEAAAGKEDHLRYIQLPFSLAMPEALMETQQLEGEAVPVLEAARRLGIQVVASAPLCQGQILGKIPKTLGDSLGEGLSDAQQVLQFARSAPGLLTALVGMKTPLHLKDNLRLCRVPPMDAPTYIATLQSSG